MRRAVPILVTFIAGTSVAGADELRLKDGQSFTGIVTEEGGEVVVRMDIGSIAFPKEEVAAIVRGESPLAELERRRRALAPGDTEGLYRLGLWAEKAGLATGARSIQRAVLAIQPDHRGARAALGYRFVDGQWLTEDEHMTKRGFVRRRGEWVDAAMATTMDEAEAKRRETARRLAEQSRVEELERQVRLAREEAERARRAAEEAKAAGERVIVPYGYVPYRRRAPGQHVYWPKRKSP